jgi:hypothetical protein
MIDTLIGRFDACFGPASPVAAANDSLVLSDHVENEAKQLWRKSQQDRHIRRTASQLVYGSNRDRCLVGVGIAGGERCNRLIHSACVSGCTSPSA